jgi:hypothetical protein
VERIEGLVTEGRDLTAAFRQSYAFHDGKALAAEYRQWQQSLRVVPGPDGRRITEDDARTIAYIVARWPRKPAQVS